MLTHTKTNTLRRHYSELDANGNFAKQDAWTETGDEPDHDEETKKREKKLKSVIKKLEKGMALKDGDFKEKNTIDDYDFDNSVESDEDDKKALTKTKNLTFQEAQKQTYALMDTIKQLNGTIDALGPRLEEGSKIIKKFEKFKLK